MSGDSDWSGRRRSDHNPHRINFLLFKTHLQFLNQIVHHAIVNLHDPIRGEEGKLGRELLGLMGGIQAGIGGDRVIRVQSARRMRRNGLPIIRNGAREGRRATGLPVGRTRARLTPWSYKQTKLRHFNWYSTSSVLEFQARWWWYSRDPPGYWAKAPLMRKRREKTSDLILTKAESKLSSRVGASAGRDRKGSSVQHPSPSQTGFRSQWIGLTMDRQGQDPTDPLIPHLSLYSFWPN